MTGLVKRGFTIVELSISIAFISVLSIIVVLLINNAVSAYHRGVTLNQLNTTGMDLVDDMRAAVQSAPGVSLADECGSLYDDGSALSACQEDGGMSFVRLERYVDVQIKGGNKVTVPGFGAFCTGTYSYVWNSGYMFNEEEYTPSIGAASLTYSLMDTNGIEATQTGTGKFLKIRDSNRAVCKAGAGVLNDKYITQETALSGLAKEAFDLTPPTSSSGCQLLEVCGALDEKAEDVLASSSSLAVYDLTVAEPAVSGSSGNMYYAVSFILGTVQGGINVDTSGNYCATPEGYNSEVENFDYCAINKFNFAAQATGRKQ